MRSRRRRWRHTSAEATFHKPLIFCKFFFWKTTVDNEKAVDMAKEGVIIMDSGDKGNAVAKWRFDLLKRFAGEFP